MAKALLTKTQQKRAFLAIKQKARKLWVSTMQDIHGWTMSTPDMIAIEKICDKYLKKF